MCGQHCTIKVPNRRRTVAGFEKSTVCLETVMARCYSTISDDALDHMFINAPEVIEQVRLNGSITDDLLDRLKIAKLPEGQRINRDDLVTWRQHAHVLSHSDSKAKFINYLQMRADKNNPVLQLQLKQQEQAARIIARETAANEKTAAAIRDRDLKAADKAAEKERRNRLTPVEAKLEAAARKAETARKKAERIQLGAERLRIALDVVGAEHFPDENVENDANDNEPMDDDHFAHE